MNNCKTNGVECTMKLSVGLRIKFKILNIINNIKTKIKWKIFYILFKNKDSNLIKHAENEMKIVGLDKPDSDYSGMLYNATIELMMIFSGQGHSGFSAQRTLFLFNELAHFKNLSPITSREDEWMNVSEYFDKHKRTIYQNRRNPSLFSDDNLKHYYSVDDKKRKRIKL